MDQLNLGEKKETKFHTKCTETGVDWISELPDDLIVQILSLLPLADACKTTLLSKRWQNLWTSIENVNFKCCNLIQFIFVTDNVLSQLTCSKIKSFSLSVAFPYGDEPCHSKFDKWLEMAVNKNVENLNLALTDYILPQVLCNSSSLRELECTECEISEDCVLSWTSLKSLTLESFDIGDEQIKQISIGCPQLEFLKLVECGGFRRIHITSPKIRRLQLIYYWYLENKWSHYDLEIIAPYVQQLKISGNFGGVEIRFGDLSSLVHADLTFPNYECLRRLDDVIYNTTVINNILGSIRCAYELTIPSWLVEVISLLMFEKEVDVLPFLVCKQLTINSWFTTFSFLAIASLLRSAPDLENLRILPEWDYCGVKRINEYVEELEWDEDIDLSEDNFVRLQHNILKGSLLHNLKNVKVISEFYSSSEDGARQLPQFLRLLLKNAISLETVVISTEHRECNKCSTNGPRLIKMLEALPRASDSAVISYIDILEE